MGAFVESEPVSSPGGRAPSNEIANDLACAVTPCTEPSLAITS